LGLRDQLKGKRVYFDANVFIYLMEGYAALESELHEIRDSILHGETHICTSELTLCEVLVPAFRGRNSGLLSLYRQFIEDSGAFELLPTSRETYIRASLLRAELGMKTPDAIHMASAIESACTAFLTNDKPIKGPKAIKILRFSSATL
jgi:predicted nucleic acid-binding protein